MVNAWSLAYETLYGDMDKTYPIKKMKLRPKTMKISDKTLTLLKNFSNIINRFSSSKAKNSEQFLL